MPQQTVDVQIQAVLEYYPVLFPTYQEINAIPAQAAEAARQAWAAFALRLSELSAQGYTVQLHTPAAVILGKIVQLRRVQADLGSLVLPIGGRIA
jgi:hypothetical protein